MNRRVLTALPVYNEERHLLEVLPVVRRYSQEVLVVDDGSTDRTPLLLAEMEGLSVVRHEPNQGYGAALRTAFQYTLDHGYDALVTIDCDGQHEPRLIPRIVERLFAPEQPPVDIVSGSRYLQQFPGDNAPPADRRRINLEITAQLNQCFGLSLTDSFCGFKAYRAEALRQLEITDPGYAMPLQLWVQAVRRRLRIVEFPVPLVYLDLTRSFGGALDVAERRLAHYRSVLQREMRLQHVDCGSCP